MNADFPRIITLLRKEKNLSQKQAAADLGISQALLSHYEKGIRECGLEFLVRIARYYDVSCDYLVGITPNRQGAMLRLDETPDNEKVFGSQNSILPNLNKRLIMNSVLIIFDILTQIGNKNLTNDVSSYLMVSIYKMFRLLYSSNKQNPQGMFSVSTEVQEGLSSAFMFVAHTNAEMDLSMLHSSKNLKDKEVFLSPREIQDKYPQYAAALAKLIQITEQHMKMIPE